MAVERSASNFVVSVTCSDRGSRISIKESRKEEKKTERDVGEMGVDYI